jgi:hypothetical protein
LNGIGNKRTALIKNQYVAFEKDLLHIKTFENLIKEGFANQKQIDEFFKERNDTLADKEKNIREAKTKDLEVMEKIVKTGLMAKGSRMI